MAKAVSLPINTLIIMALGIVIVLALAIFVSGGIFSSESELSEQQALTGCCARACRNPTNLESAASLNLIVCSAEGDSNWNAMSIYDTGANVGMVTLWEIASSKSGSTEEEDVTEKAQAICSC